MKILRYAFCLFMLGSSTTTTAQNFAPVNSVELGPRPFWLAETLPESDLKEALRNCDTTDIKPHAFSIGHRGAPMQLPEHTRESYLAAARMGAGVIECDVAFTADKELVCRHSQCDLHTTTNILDTELAARCSIPPDYSSNTPFSEVQCCTSDVTLEEFITLEGKMEAGNPEALTLEQYLASTPSSRTDAYASRGTLMTHAESIKLFDQLGVDMTPELKKDLGKGEGIGFSRAEQADKMLEEYRKAGIEPSRVWPQSFEEEDIAHWLDTAPEFTDQLVYLDDRYKDSGFDPMSPKSWKPDMQSLKDSGVNWLAPPLWALVTARDGRIVPSLYAESARAAGIGLIAWTLERSDSLSDGSRGGWYYQSVSELIDDESAVFEMLDVLAQDVGVAAVFSDWAATTSFYAHCRL